MSEGYYVVPVAGNWIVKRHRYFYDVEFTTEHDAIDHAKALNDELEAGYRILRDIERKWLFDK